MFCVFPAGFGCGGFGDRRVVKDYSFLLGREDTGEGKGRAFTGCGREKREEEKADGGKGNKEDKICSRVKDW